jgi:mono/diheme cytochrome c family protein
MQRWCPFSLLPSCLLAASAAAQDDARFFEDEVLPILAENCFECHGSGARLRGGLRLTRRAAILGGGESGPAVALNDPGASLLLKKLSYANEFDQMPPDGKLADEDIAVLRRWVERGLPWSDAVTIEEGAAEEAQPRLTKGDGREGWAYGQVARPAVPAVADAAWVANPVDAFILRRLEDAGLAPAPPADRGAWLRRVTYDLIGLPPTPAEVDAFLADDTRDAFEAVTERLLASPRYGEKWGRHWLDVVRYAETNGFERDGDKPHIWRYRDYVIDAFNADKPYDQFVREQLAGDELDEVTNETRIATGFLRLMQWDDEPPQGRLQARYDVLDDLVRTTSEGLLGTTLGCARCHDHKGDALTQVDYYSFMSFFHGVSDYRTEGTLVEVFTPEERAAHERALAAHVAELAASDASLSELEQEFARRAVPGATASGLTDLRYRYYRDTWSELPDFDALRHETAGELAGGRFDLALADREEAFGFVFEGQLAVPADGAYRFVLDSDDGARLSIDGAPVVERDGVHAQGDPQVGEVHLSAGSHAARLDFFQSVGGAALTLDWLRVDDLVWRHTFEEPGAGWEALEFDDARWDTGEGGFGTPGTPGAQVGTLWSGDAVWLRRTFDWSGPADDLVLVAHHDEDVDVFINGVRAAHGSGFLRGYAVLELEPAARAAVQVGENLLAVRAVNTAGGQFVDVRPVPRSATLGRALADVAHGRRALSASPTVEHAEELRARILEQGRELLGASEHERYKRLVSERARLVRMAPTPKRLANVVVENGPEPAQLHVHIRGNAAAQGKPVEPAFPACLAPPTPVFEPRASSSGRRRALADWIASPDNPLTARVMVNRIWQHHFGRGIVPTPNDFGELGERPTHPELLDWLAAEFVEHGWSVKHMHRVMLASNAYRMSCAGNERALVVDGHDELLWRFRMRRLTAEELRDSIINTTGALNTRLGGPSFYSLIPEEALATSSRPESVWGKAPAAETLRRSVYIKVKRSLFTPILANHDLADTDSSCPVRFATTSPVQALGLLNGEFVNLRARGFAERLAREHPEDLEAQVRLARRLVAGRAPSAAEKRDDLAFIAELRADFGLAPADALQQYCLLLLNLNEFVYLD